MATIASTSADWLANQVKRHPMTLSSRKPLWPKLITNKPRADRSSDSLHTNQLLLFALFLVFIFFSFFLFCLAACPCDLSWIFLISSFVLLYTAACFFIFLEIILVLFFFLLFSASSSFSYYYLLFFVTSVLFIRELSGYSFLSVSTHKIRPLTWVCAIGLSPSR